MSHAMALIKRVEMMAQMRRHGAIRSAAAALAESVDRTRLTPVACRPASARRAP
jgi:hypothetical protein